MNRVQDMWRRQMIEIMKWKKGSLRIPSEGVRDLTFQWESMTN